MKKMEITFGARNKMIRVPLHSIRYRNSNIKPWEGGGF